MNRTAQSTRSPESPELRREPIVGNYFVSVYPPFSCWNVEQIPALDEALRGPSSDEPLGIYVHVPFCQKKCDYCYYLSYVGQSSEVVDRYLETVIGELALYAAQPAVRGRRVAFVYFGGGTPSTLTTAQARRLAEGLRNALSWTGVEEVTFECAPRSVRPDFLAVLREIGVSRISMGIQSFDNALLELNGRIHSAQDAVRAFRLIREAGFDLVNIDLMTGLLGETREQWRQTVREAIALEPESVTVYQTEIPFNTEFYRLLKAGRLGEAPATWETKRSRLSFAFDELDRAGYTVINAYMAVRHPKRHGFLYQDYLWSGSDMLGLGVASFGYFGSVHYQNETGLEGYEAEVARGCQPVQRAYALSARDRLVREFVLQLKTGCVPSRPFQEKFGVDLSQVFAAPLAALCEDGLLSLTPAEIRLTGVGLLQVDRLLSRFYDPPFQNLRYT